MYKTRY